MKIKYNNWNPKQVSIDLVNIANSIIIEYDAAGYTLTLRQLYYQFVARDIIPNTERSYKNLGSLITRGRMAGLISYEVIEQQTETRELLSRVYNNWEAVKEVLNNV